MNYGLTDGQIGQETQQSYLQAMRQVYAEVGKVSDVIAIVTKNPTRAGQLRRLDLDSIRLLEETGWHILCVHQAQLFTETETTNLFGETQKKIKGRMSFFKRLSYQKGNAVADHEDVIIAVRNGGSDIVTVSSPPYEDMVMTGEGPGVGAKGATINAGQLQNYGSTPGQIGNLK